MGPIYHFFYPSVVTFQPKPTDDDDDNGVNASPFKQSRFQLYQHQRQIFVIKKCGRAWWCQWLIYDYRYRIRSLLAAHDATVGDDGSANNERRTTNDGTMTVLTTVAYQRIRICSRAAKTAILTDAFPEEDRLENQ